MKAQPTALHRRAINHNYGYSPTYSLPHFYLNSFLHSTSTSVSPGGPHQDISQAVSKDTIMKITSLVASSLALAEVAIAAPVALVDTSSAAIGLTDASASTCHAKCDECCVTDVLKRVATAAASFSVAEVCRPSESYSIPLVS